VQFEEDNAEQVSIRKKFSFEKSSENKDNYVIEMDVDLENRGTNHIKALVILWRWGRQRRFIPRIIIVTRLVWCIDGRAKGIDGGWFGSSGGFLGVAQRAARPYTRRTSPAPSGLQ